MVKFVFISFTLPWLAKPFQADETPVFRAFIDVVKMTRQGLFLNRAG
jgi:hypothetical protein